MRDEMTPVRAVRECSLKLDVTYGVRVLVTPLAKATMNAMSHMLGWLVDVCEVGDGTYKIYAVMRSLLVQT